MEAKLKHLDFIQSVISRMAGNSFMLKGWSVTIVSALFALASKDSDKRWVLISLLPILLFWLLDGYFLHQERMFRALYDKVSKLTEKDIDFSMKLDGLDSGKNTYGCSLFSGTVLSFHIAILLGLVGGCWLLGVF